MMRKKRSLFSVPTEGRRSALLFALLLCGVTLRSQSNVDADSIRGKMQWFADAKLGIFIHMGIYSVNGIDESWSFYNKKISWTDYMKQLKGFTASRYDPAALAALIKESGARYAVMTTKHHDGVALWPTKQDHYNVVKNTPAKRDLLKPFYDALEKQGIKKGAYFSLIDWSHKDYPGFLKDSNRYVIANDTARWNGFRNFFQSQIREINIAYKPDLWWFDGDWEHNAAEWQSAKVRRDILAVNPAAIINGRLQGYGDYETPEQNFPVSRPKYNWWELCMTINNNWGYQPQDKNFKTPFEIISIFVDAVSNGGNLLLDIGPKADGSVPDEEVNVLKELGKWNSKNGEAIFGTVPALPQGHFYGPCTMTKDSSTLFLFIPNSSVGNVMVKGLMSGIKDVEVLGTSEHLTPKIVGKISWSRVPGLVFIDVPERAKDQYMTVLKLKLDGPMRLYRGQGGL